MYESAGSNAAGGAMMGVFWLVWVGAYLFFSYCQYRIAVKADHQTPWYAFIPIVNIFQLISIAQKEWWWFVLCFVPLVNIFAIAVIWMEISKNIGQSPAWGIAMLVPFVNLIALLYLAFSSTPQRPSFQAPQQQPVQKVPQ